MDWATVVDHGLTLFLILVSSALTYATLLASNRTLLDALRALAKRRETTSGQHSARTVRERCRDPHKHSGCDWPTVKRHG